MVSPKRQVPFGKTSAILRWVFGHETFDTQGTETNKATLADKHQSWFGCHLAAFAFNQLIEGELLTRPNLAHTSPTLPLG